jgi:Transposase
MYYVGIDVASRESAVCILDSKGKIVREAKLSTDPEALGRFLADTGLAIERVGLESGCTAAWLFTGLQERGWPMICIVPGTPRRRRVLGMRIESDGRQLTGECVPDRPKTAPRPKRRSQARWNLGLSVNCFTPGDRQAPISLRDVGPSHMGNLGPGDNPSGSPGCQSSLSR